MTESPLECGWTWFWSVLLGGTATIVVLLVLSVPLGVASFCVNYGRGLAQAMLQ